MKRTQFELNGKEYWFSLSPEDEATEQGPTLTCVAKDGRRADPTKHAESEAWQIAAKRFKTAGEYEDWS